MHQAVLAPTKFLIVVFTLLAVPFFASATSITLQDGLNGYSGTSDADININDTSANTGSATTLRLGSYGQLKSLFKFDLSSIPSGATVNSATLNLYAQSTLDNGGGNTVNLYRILGSWTEMGVTWGNLDATSNYGSSVESSPTVGYLPANQWMNFPVTSLVQSWVNGSVANNGVALLISNGPRVITVSRENSSSTFRPQLVIDYTASGGGATPPPADTQAPATCTTFTYTAWGTCQSNSTQSRTITSSSPQGCTGGSPVLIQSCVYTAPAPATGAYYISPNGSDTNSGTSSSAPFKTFTKAFSVLPGGGELILLDGTYSVAAGTGIISDTGTNSGQIPSGVSRNQMTYVHAQNPGSVTINGGLKIGTISRKDSYIKVEGITFDGGTTALGANLYNTSNIHIKNSGFHSETQGAGSVFSIGTNDANATIVNSDILVEDSWAWGKERSALNVYRSEKVVIRRVVTRNDGCYSSVLGCGNNPGNQMVGTTIYNSNRVSFQNVIAVDNTRGTNGYAGAGDFYIAYHNNFIHPWYQNEWLGTISLNSGLSSGYGYDMDNLPMTASPMATYRNIVAWNTQNPWLANMNCGTCESHNLVVSNATLKGSSGTGFYINSSMSNSVIAPKNMVVLGTGGTNTFGVSSPKQTSYVDVSGTWSGGNYNGTSAGTGSTTTDPTLIANGSLLYITHIESGSPLKGAGESGADIGANIMYRYGIDGTFRGETGYDTLTSEPLWNYPNEARIKKEMCTDTGITRGFCSSSSLTKYIWEAAGNPMPANLYDGTPAPPAPAPVQTCTTFTYSAWGTCQSGSTQSRTVTSSSPSGCTGGTPVLSQSCTYTPPVTVSTKFSLNDRVQVSSGTLNVRATPSITGTFLGTQASGHLGTVIGGPTTTDGYTWWNINFDSGSDGWSVEDFLVKYTTVSSTPTPTPTPTPALAPAPAGGGGGTTSPPPSTETTTITGGIASTASTTIAPPIRGLTTDQVTAIIQLLQSFGADASVIQNVRASLAGGTTTTGNTVSATPTTLPTTFFGVGHRGIEVNQLQQTLTALGFYSGPITGYFGPLTEAALIKFQTAKNVPPTGYFGPRTRAKLTN